MRTSNPALNEKAFQRLVPQDQTRAGWAAPAPEPDTISPWTPAPPPGAAGDVMTVGGSVSASAVLLLITVVAGALGWQTVEPSPEGVEMPGWIFPLAIAGFVIGIVTIFKPHIARFTGPIYAATMGVFVGAISHLYEIEFKGIVLNAIGLTIGVFAVMLFLYATRIIKVTEKLRMGIVCATGAIMLVYLVNLVMRVFGSQVPFIHDATPLGIGISLVIVGIAAFNLLLDFDFVEKGVAAGAPKKTEWYAAFGLLVTLIWLYLELLRLLSKLQRR